MVKAVRIGSLSSTRRTEASFTNPPLHRRAAVAGGLGLGARQGEEEAAPPAQLALHPDVAAVQLHELARDRQSQPRAVVRARAGGVHLRELLEDQLVELRVDADPRVRDGDLHPVRALGGAAGLHHEMALLRGELDGVADQVPQHVRHLVLVRPHRRQPRLGAHVEVQVLAVQERGVHPVHAVHDLSTGNSVVCSVMAWALVRA
jgi:hypothetical protein